MNDFRIVHHNFYHIDMNQEQILKNQGWSDENIAKLQAISSNPQAYNHAMQTGDINTAYQMTLQKEKPEVHNLNEWFGSFCKEDPDNAKSLSIALTKFARYVQSQCDKLKDS